MKNEMFQELLQSMKEGGEILKGKKKPARSFKIKEPDIQKVRTTLGLSQEKFACLLGISVSTLRNWEQGRRKPEGPARILIRIAAKHPEVFPDVVGI